MQEARAIRTLIALYDSMVQSMTEMHTACQIKPIQGSAAIRPGGGSGIRLHCGPIVCLVPERANSSDANLYVVVEGTLDLDPTCDDLVTTGYQTNFAYFRVRDNEAAHVFGGHFDFGPGALAHPWAHMQLKSQKRLFGSAQDQFHGIGSVTVEADPMQDVLGRVRTPTAQMDCLSFLLQVCADHLVYEGSSDRIRTRFHNLSATCTPLKGYPNPEAGCDCLRSPHWYLPAAT